MLSDEEQDRFEDAVAVISEHFPNYALAVLSEENELLEFDFSGWRVGRMLFRDSLEAMERDMAMVDEMDTWEVYEEDDEDYE